LDGGVTVQREALTIESAVSPRRWSAIEVNSVAVRPAFTAYPSAPV
jgi:hypothetical protein